MLYSSEALSKVIEETFSLNEPAGSNVGIFTTTSKNKATDIYQRLTVTQLNTESLQSMSNSLVVISIDEHSTNSNEAIHNLLLSGRNKYFDMTLQIVMTKASELGYCVEYTAVDGTTSFAVIQDVQIQLISTDLENIEMNVQPTVEKLDWMLSAEVQQELHALEKENKKSDREYFTHVVNFEALGTDEIKRLGFSPDSFFHMALQVAQYKTFGMMRSPCVCLIKKEPNAYALQIQKI